MTIQDAHQLNKGDKIRVILNGITIDAEVDSTSISEVGVTIWFYDIHGKYLSTNVENVTFTGTKSLSKEDKFISFINKSIKESACMIDKNAYRRVKDKFKTIFNE